MAQQTCNALEDGTSMDGGPRVENQGGVEVAARGDGIIRGFEGKAGGGGKGQSCPKTIGTQSARGMEKQTVAGVSETVEAGRRGATGLRARCRKGQQGEGGDWPGSFGAASPFVQRGL